MSCLPERVKLRRISVLKAPCHYLPFHPAFLHRVGADNRHIDHICQLAGNTNHVRIGSDLDGAFGKE